MGFVFKQITDSMQKGIARGIFSNEAGLGSAPIAASTVQTNEPVEQGLVNMTGTVIDTLIICTMTGLSIIIAFYGDLIGGVANWNGEAQGAVLTATAFSKILGGDGHSVSAYALSCILCIYNNSRLGLLFRKMSGISYSRKNGSC